MPELPPRADVIDVLEAVVAPTLGATVAVACLLTALLWLLSKRVRFDWRKATPSIAMLALAAGLVAGNHYRGGFENDYEKWSKWWHWAWPAMGFALLVEFVASLPGLPAAAGYLLRGTAAGVVAWAVTPEMWLKTPADKWIVPAVAFALAIQWAIIAAVGRQAPGGSTSAAVAVAALGAVAILMHHRWNPTGTTVTTALFAALAALAVLAWVTKADVSSAAAATVLIATMLLLGRALLDSNVPRRSFLLVGLSPTVLGVFLLPKVNHFSQYRAATPVKVLLVLIPVAVAVYLAMEAEPLKFEIGSGADEW
jgi:hypothetical protein